MTLLPNLAFLRLKSLAMRKKKDEHGENRVESLLKPIGDLQGDGEYDSDVSEISDVFEEFHKNSHLRYQPQEAKRYLTKHEADVRTMDEFTEDFKETMEKVRNDLDIGERLLLETPEDVQKVFDDPEDSDIFPKISPNREILEEVTDSIPHREELRQTRKASDSSSGSIIWHMLAANSDSRKFAISPPGFDTFKQEQPHWLQRASVSWLDIDQAKLKCENWLERHCGEIQAKRK